MPHLRKIVIAISLLLSFVMMTTGCALFRSIDNSTSEEIQKFKTSKDDLWNQVESLKMVRAVYQQQLAEQQTEITRITGELADSQTEAGLSGRRVAALNKTIDGLNAQMKLCQQQAVALQSPKESVDERSPIKIKIKVLAGDGNIASARNLSKRLSKMGYPVKLIDMAPRSDFQANTIFFGRGYQSAAATLVTRMGKGTISKPLTWQSVFNIIVVTGRNS